MGVCGQWSNDCGKPQVATPPASRLDANELCRRKLAEKIPLGD